MSESQIRQFYENQNVFVTGGTGFMGKILIEKLLRSTNASTIYLLIRKNKGKIVEERLREMLDNEPFLKLKEKHPDFKNRLSIVNGDTRLPNLGLTTSDQQILASNANIVFHVAATVRFDENIKEAYQINVEGTRNLINLCKTFKCLKSAVYVSTAYINCDVSCIEEKFYDVGNYRNIGHLIEKSSQSEASQVISSILQQWPNTYTFTKAMAEQLIQDRSEDIPLGIFRPAIVTSTYKEPVEGWLDNYGGATSLAVGLGFGFLRVLPMDPHLFAELVPVDMSISALIATAWDVAMRRKHNASSKKIPIYNYISSTDNPLTYIEFIQLLKIQFARYPLNKSMWTPKMVALKKTTRRFFLLNFLYHYIPAAIIDVLNLLLFHKPHMISKYRKSDLALERLRFVLEHKWSFKNANMRTLWAGMTHLDKEHFPFDFSTLHWVDFVQRHCRGLRHYLLKDPSSTLTSAKMKAKRFQIVHQILKFGICYVGVSLLWMMITKTVTLVCGTTKKIIL